MHEAIIKGINFYEKIRTLKKVEVDIQNWNTYYIDEGSGEKWIEEYLFPEAHGGGPPQLRLISKFPWENISEV